MEGIMHSDISLFNGTEINHRLLAAMFLVSMILHVLFFGVFLFIPSQPHRKFMIPPAITVSMVSLPAEEETVNMDEPAEPEEQAPLVTADEMDIKATNPEEPPVLADNPEIPEMQPEVPPGPVPPPETVTQPEVQPENIPEPKELVVIKDLPEEEKKVPVPEKIVEKKPPQEEKPPAQPVKIIKPDPRTKKPEKIKEEAVRPEDVNKESIKQAVERVRNKVARETAKAAPSSSSSSSGTAGGRVSSGPVNDIYRAQITYHIEQNWAFSEQLVKKHNDLETHVAVRVLPNGNVENVWFQRKSGDTYLDDSAYRAVMKSNPFPPLPQGYSEAHTFILRFTPSGLN
jgi:TonB family protein